MLPLGVCIASSSQPDVIENWRVLSWEQRDCICVSPVVNMVHRIRELRISDRKRGKKELIIEISKRLLK